MDLLLLAQSMEAAEKGLSLIERLQAGGVPLISLVIAVVCGLAFYWQLRRNIKAGEERVADRDAHLEEVKDRAKAQLTEQESLLREMLAHSQQSQEAQLASVQVVEGFAAAMRDSMKVCESTNRLVTELDARIKDLESTVRRGG
jgi:CHASE3 domain sensor protein